MRSVRRLLIAGTLALLGAAPRARAEPVDPSFSETPIGGLPGAATAMAWAPDASERLFVTLQDGSVFIVRRVAPGAAQWQSTRFTTLTPVFDNVDSGLLGLAFDPDFESTHYAYFFVTASPTEQQILRFTVMGDLAANKTVLVTGLPTVGLRNNGGGIGIGPDHRLYFGVGDLGQGRGVGADLASLAAKIGRASLGGAVPNDNPFFDGNGPNADYVFARGVRDPRSLSFQPATGALWAAVAGDRYEQVFVVRRADHAGYLAYENDQPAGYITPIVKYRTGDVDALALTPDGAVRASSLSTFTTATPHGFRRGERISIRGVTDASFDGEVYVAATPSPTTFSATQADADALSGGGTASTQALGGRILGGAFYDATQFPREYRGNYLFADYDSGQIMRAVLAAPSDVQRVDVFAHYASDHLVDLDVGPDGALYALFSSGNLVRIAYTPPGQGLVLSQRNVWMSPRSTRSLMVRLAVAPSSTNVIVRAEGVAGDRFIEVTPAALIFKPSNWNVAQTFTLGRADVPAVMHAAKVDVSSAGLTTESVIVHAYEDMPDGLALATSTLSVAEGQSASFPVALAAPPLAATTVSVVRAAGSAYLSVSSGAELTFTPDNYATPQLVTVSVADDPGDGASSATLSLSTRGFATRYVAVAILDNDASAPQLTSTPPDGSGVDIPYAYTATATGLPTPTFQLTDAPSGMTIDASSGALGWTPDATGTYSVTLLASNGVAPDATQSFVIHVGGPLACGLLFPQQDQVVSGTGRYFSGYGSPADDSIVPVLKAEFLIDAVVAYTDAGPQGTYHFGGAEALWDTTAYDDGPHSVGIRITDAIGQTCNHTVGVTIANHPLADAGVGSMDAGPQPMDAGPVEDAASDAMTGGAVDAGADATTPDGGGASGAGGEVGDAAPAGGQDSAVIAMPPDGERPDAAPPAEMSAPSPGCGCRIANAPGSVASRASLAALMLAFALRRRRRG